MSAETDQMIALGFAPNKVRGAFTTLLQLDARFAQIVRQTREVTLGQIKLQWWYDQLIKVGASDQVADPLLGDAIAHFGHHDVIFESLARLTRGWDLLFEPLPFDATHLMHYAIERGARLFEIAAHIVGERPSDTLCSAGAGWALSDFAYRCSDRQTAETAQTLACEQFSSHPQRKFSRDLRPFALLAHFAGLDAKSGLHNPRSNNTKRRAFEALRFSLLR